MARAAPEGTQDTGYPWGRSATRVAILAAARRVAERDGVYQVSLTSVAAEAEFAPNTVYAYFSNKNDLLQAVVADDLTDLARALNGPSGEQAARKAPASEVQKAEVQKAEPVPVSQAAQFLSVVPPVDPRHDAVSLRAGNSAQTQPDIVEPADERNPSPQASSQFVAVGSEPATGDPAPETASKMPDMSDRAADSVAQLRDAVARLETRPVDAWLERRLREFERALAALEDRQKTSRGGDTSDDKVSEDVRELRERLDQLGKQQDDPDGEKLRAVIGRIEASEKQVRQSISDLQAEWVQVSRRLTALENAAFAASPEFFQRIPARPAQQLPEAAELPLSDPGANQAPRAAELVPPDSTDDSFLAAARRSAQASLERKEQGGSVLQSGLAKWRYAENQKLYAGVFAGVLILLLIGIGLFLRQQVLSEAATPVFANATRHHVWIATRPTLQKIGSTQPSAVPNAVDARKELMKGLGYLDADGPSQNIALALQWLTRAAAHGDPVAQYRLGALYQDGRLVPANPATAFRYFEAAALQGNRKAMHSVAIAYAQGWGTPKNYDEAARWFLRAAQFGFINAQFNLGVLYERGLGVPQSLLDAYKWYAIAAAQGDTESQARIAALKTQMKAADIAVAEEGAAAFAPAPLDPVANFVPRNSALPSG